MIEGPAHVDAVGLGARRRVDRDQRLDHADVGDRAIGVIDAGLVALAARLHRAQAVGRQGRAHQLGPRGHAEEGLGRAGALAVIDHQVVPARLEVDRRGRGVVAGVVELVEHPHAVDPQALAVLGEVAEDEVAAGVDAQLAHPPHREVVAAGDAEIGGLAAAPRAARRRQPIDRRLADRRGAGCRRSRGPPGRWCRWRGGAGVAATPARAPRRARWPRAAAGRRRPARTAPAGSGTSRWPAR